MTTPKCPYYGRCGGCSMQHVDYSTQIDQKKELLSQAVRGFNSSEIKVFSDKEYGYRNRMDFVFHKGGLGFRKKGKWYEIVDIKQCVIANEGVNKLLSEVRDFFCGKDSELDYFHVKKHTGTFRYCVIRCPSGKSSISFVLNPESSRLADAIEKIKKFAEKSSADNVVVTYVNPESDTSISEDFFFVKGSEELEEEMMGKRFGYHVQGFFQNNTKMAEKMHEYVHSLLQDYEDKEGHLLDLYGGVGTFGILNAGLFKDFKTVEAFEGCINSARENMKINNISNGKGIVLDAKQLEKLELKKEGKVYVITDPPRTGMHPKAIKAVNRLQPEVIIYVSCNLKQLAKELPRFFGYEVKSAAVFDLFPQTMHCEGVVELVKKKKEEKEM